MQPQQKISSPQQKGFEMCKIYSVGPERTSTYIKQKKKKKTSIEILIKMQEVSPRISVCCKAWPQVQIIFIIWNLEPVNVSFSLKVPFLIILKNNNYNHLKVLNLIWNAKS